MTKAAITIACLTALFAASAEPVSACAMYTRSGAAEMERSQDTFLRKASDKRVQGTWRFEAGEAENFDGFFRVGIIETADGRKFRVELKNEINCGFPFYSLIDGDAGLFYLKRSDIADEDDLEDGLIDNYNYVHFRSGKRAED